MDRIPAFLAIDVEPDAFQISRESPPEWDGFVAMLPFFETLRQRLNSVGDVPAVFGWYLRTDPQIAEVYGRADFALRHYEKQLAALRALGDYIGAHPHPLVWSEARRAWVHDHEDVSWLRACTASSLAIFADATGTPARHIRFGAGFLCNEIVDAAEAHGVFVDLTLEPVAGWGLRATDVPTTVDSSPIVGAYLDCEGAPREPYQPDREEFRAALAYGKRSIHLIPLSTYIAAEKPAWAPTLQTLYPSVPWPSPAHFWDVALRQLISMERPYLSLAVRTNTHDMALTAGVRKIFEALPEHEISKYLRWMDPLDALDQLVAA